MNVFFPVQLRQLSGGRDLVRVDLAKLAGPTLRDLIEHLEAIESPGLKALILDTSGELRRYIQVMVNNRHALSLATEAKPADADVDWKPKALDAVLHCGDEVAILPAFAVDKKDERKPH